MYIGVTDFLMEQLAYEALIARADSLRLVADVESRNLSGPVVCWKLSRQHPDERCLPRTIFTQ